MELYKIILFICYPVKKCTMKTPFMVICHNPDFNRCDTLSQ